MPETVHLDAGGNFQRVFIISLMVLTATQPLQAAHPGSGGLDGMEGPRYPLCQV